MKTTVDLLGRSLAFKLGVALMGIAILALGFAAYRSAEAGVMAREGVLVEGRVLEKFTNESRRTSGGVSRYETVWNLRYRYAPTPAQSIEEVREIPRTLWESLEPGGPLELRYLPDAPSRHQIVGSQIEDHAFAFLAGGGVFGIAGLVLVIGSAFAASRTARLLAQGVEREGEVLTVDKLAKSGGPDRWRVTYRYTDDAGETHTRSTTVPRSGVRRPEVGARVPILMDPSRPAHSRWVEEV